MCSNDDTHAQVQSLPTVDEIVEICFKKFYMLPKAALPKPNEWTVMAAVILYNETSRKSQVISVGSGTKCIGRSKLCSKGLILNDCHAEVLARRGFLRYLYAELKKSLKSNAHESIFNWFADEAVFKLKAGYSFHFLSTQTPCGDACIIDNRNKVTCYSNSVYKKIKLQNVWDNKNGMLPAEIIHTGARLIGEQHADTMRQLTGAVRTKPGRGERTLSMSCSDKLAKWQIVGVQGALIASLIDKPIYFKTLNFCGNNDIQSLERAVWLRFDSNNYQNCNFQLQKPIIRLYQTDKFPYKQSVQKQPTSNGVVWCEVPQNEKCLEVSVNGKRQGVTSKHLHTPRAALKICKYYLYENFLNLIKLKSALLSKFQIQSNELDTLHYNKAKLMAVKYQEAWMSVKLYYFKEWIQKPTELLTFTATSQDEDFLKKEQI